jgi:hypothetical protein
LKAALAADSDIAINLRNQSLKDGMQMLQEQLGVPVRLDVEALGGIEAIDGTKPGSKIESNFESMKLTRILHGILSTRDRSWAVRDGGIFITSLQEAYKHTKLQSDVQGKFNNAVVIVDFSTPGL